MFTISLLSKDITDCQQNPVRWASKSLKISEQQAALVIYNVILQRINMIVCRLIDFFSKSYIEGGLPELSSNDLRSWALYTTINWLPLQQQFDIKRLWLEYEKVQGVFVTFNVNPEVPTPGAVTTVVNPRK